MIRTVSYVVLLVVLAAGLSACTTTVGSARLQFALSESGDLGYEVDTDGVVTITTRNMRFRSAAGAYGATITEYAIMFFDRNGAPVGPGASQQRGSVNLFVPPGIACDTPDEVYGCQIGAVGWSFAPGIEVATSQNYQLLPVSVVEAHLLAGVPAGWYAEIEFDGFDAAGRVFTTDPYVLAIATPN